MKSALALLTILLASSLHAASEFPPSYRWRTIETEHFLVHYHQGEEELARRAATIGEQVHARISPLLGWEPAQRTHLILTDHIDASNGEASTFPENRIEIFVSAPGADPSSPIEYYDNWVGMVITHEYAHILHLDQARGFSGFLRKALGRNPLAFPNELSPLWMIEGLATLVESEETEGGRLKGTFVDMVLRTAAIENQWATEPQAGGLTARWPEGSARYFYGSKFLSWLARTKGADKLRDYFADYSANVIPYRVNASAEDVYGTDMRTLWDDWSTQQQAEYRGEYKRIAAEGLTAKERLTSGGYETKYPIVSPDGSRVAYAYEGPYAWPSIRVWDAAAKRDVASRRVNSTSPLSWSADGTTLAFSQLEFHGSFALLSDLYTWRVGGLTVHRLTHGARLKDPSFAPDGRSLIAVENRAGRNQLVEVDAATGAIRPLVTPNDYTQFSEPNVSHDGSRIAVAEWRNGSIDVVLYDRSGKRIANLTESMPRATNASPRWERGDEAILFSSDVTGVPNIYRVAAAGGAPERLTNLYGGAFFPSSADGRRVFYSDYSSNGFDLASFEIGAPKPATMRVIPASVMGLTARRADSPVGPGPVGEPALRTYPDRPYSPWRSLIPKWWFPVVTGDENTTRVGAMTSAADVLGFHSYSATVAAGEHDVDYGIVYSYDRFYPTFTLLASQLTDEPEGIGILRNGEVVQYRERTQRFFGSVTVPYRRVRWQTFGSLGVIRDRVRPEASSDFRPGIFTGVLQGVRAAAVFNNAAEFGYSISPENGVTALLDFENLSRAMGSDATRRTARGDVRGYIAIPYASTPLGRHVLAIRGAAGRSSGDFVLQRELRVGGVGIGEFLGVDITDFPVRGYETGILRGDSAALASVEYRFPLWQIERGPATYPIFFNRLVGDVFYDTGSAWNHTGGGRAFRESNTISSAGAEVGLDLVLGFYSPLRYRVGAAYRFDKPDKASVGVYVTLGSSF